MLFLKLVWFLLKANQNFLALQDELTNTENKIAVERQRYNDAVRDYNIAINQIPTNIVAQNLGLTKKPYFESKKGSEEPVQVDFNFSKSWPFGTYTFFWNTLSGLTWENPEPLNKLRNSDHANSLK